MFRGRVEQDPVVDRQPLNGIRVYSAFREGVRGARTQSNGYTCLVNEFEIKTIARTPVQPIAYKFLAKF